jgi:hypothetical protein
MNHVRISRRVPLVGSTGAVPICSPRCPGSRGSSPSHAKRFYDPFTARGTSRDVCRGFHTHPTGLILGFGPEAEAAMSDAWQNHSLAVCDGFEMIFPTTVRLLPQNE